MRGDVHRWQESSATPDASPRKQSEAACHWYRMTEGLRQIATCKYTVLYDAILVERDTMVVVFFGSRGREGECRVRLSLGSLPGGGGGGAEQAGTGAVRFPLYYVKV